MALVDVVEQFVRLTGRYDLVANGWADDWDDPASDSLGARFYINKAQKLLDRLQPTPNSEAWHISKPASGTYKLELANLRSVKQVWVADTTERERWQLSNVSYERLRELYPTIFEDQTVGCPEYWSYYSPRQSPATQGTAYTSELDTGQMKVGNASTVRGIIWLPPSDGTYTVHVKGLFYEKALSADADTSWWTENADDVLVFAAKWILENGHKNAEGGQELTAALAPMLAEIDKDLAEEAVSDFTQFIG